MSAAEWKRNRKKRKMEHHLGTSVSIVALKRSLAQWMQDSNNIYHGFNGVTIPCVLLILCKILWHALTICLLHSFFHLCLTLYECKKLFLISVFIFLREPWKTALLTAFCVHFFIKNKTVYSLFCLRLFTFFDAV